MSYDSYLWCTTYVERPAAERAVLESEASFRGLSHQIGRHIVQAVRYEYEGGARLI